MVARGGALAAEGGCECVSGECSICGEENGENGWLGSVEEGEVELTATLRVRAVHWPRASASLGERGSGAVSGRRGGDKVCERAGAVLLSAGAAWERAVVLPGPAVYPGDNEPREGKAAGIVCAR